MTAANLPVVALTRRPWYRLHISTYFVLLACAAFFVLANWPGEYRLLTWSEAIDAGVDSFPFAPLEQAFLEKHYFSPNEDSDVPKAPSFCTHGWPSVSVFRHHDSQISDDYWSLTSNVVAVRWWAVVFDLCVAVLGAAATGAVWEFARRRRTPRPFWQFSLRKLLAFTTIVALCVGWWAIGKRRDDAIERSAQQLHLRGYQVRVNSLTRFPQWLQRWFEYGQLETLHWNRLVPIEVDYSSEHQDALRELVDQAPEAVTVAPDRHDRSICEELAQIAQLRTLDLQNSGANLFDRDIVALRSLRHLRTLRLDGNWITDNGLEILREMTDLEELSLNGCKITDKGLDIILSLKRLRLLDLGKSWLTDAGAARLGELTHLEQLNLENSEVGDRTLESLATLPRLWELKLRDTDVTDRGVAHLAACRRLAYLDLSETRVTDKVWEAVRPLSRLLTLHLDGTLVRSLNELEWHSRLPYLYLTADFTPAAYLFVVPSGLLPHQKFSVNCHYEERLLPEFSSTEPTTILQAQVQALREMHEAEFMDNEHRERRTGFDTIRRVKLHGASITNDSLTTLRPLKTLVSLWLERAYVDGSGLRELQNFPELEMLTLSNRQIDDTAVENLRKLPALKKLYLIYWKGPHSVKDAAEKVQAALPNLEIVQVYDHW